MRDLGPILITSEKDAWNALEFFVSSTTKERYVEFQGWPDFDLIVSGGRYSSTIPANLLTNLASFQRILNTCYGRFVYAGDARNLRKSDKLETELVYKVENGSTKIKADVTGFLNRLGEAMNKPSTQKVAGITLCALALIVSGAIVISKISGDVREVKIEKMRLIEKAIEIIPSIKHASDDYDALFKGLIMSVQDAGSIDINCQRVDSNGFGRFANEKNAIATTVELTKECKITSIRKYQRHFLIEVKFDKDVFLRARVYHHAFSEQQIGLLFDSIAKNKAVPLLISATKIDDGYANATITKILESYDGS